MLELEHGFRIIDVHATLAVEESGTAGSRAVSPVRLEREMQQAGIVQSVVFAQAEPPSYLRSNNTVARHAVDHPFLAFARINGPRNPADTPIDTLRNFAASRDDSHVSPADIERYGYDDRFHGFKLNPLRDGLPDEDVLEQLEAVNLPLIVHAGRGFEPEAVEATLLQWSFPVILAHFGGYPLDRDCMNAAIDMLSDHDACYLDTSVVRFRDLLERAMLEHPDRVLFGSGAPNVHPNVAVMELLTLDVPEDGMRKAFSKNVTRLLEKPLDLP